MNNNAWFKKEKPLLSLQSMGGGAAGSLMQGAAADKLYVDDLFNTDLFVGNDSFRTITNNIDFENKGGMIWNKSRTGTYSHYLTDTVRGSRKQLSTDTNAIQTGSEIGALITGFTATGYYVGDSGLINGNGISQLGWSFREAKGFFDIVSYTGDGTAGRTVSHSLGTLPGIIIIKNLDSTEDWRVYHNSIGGTKNVLLNTSDASASVSSVWNNTDPTASVFTVGTSDATNKNGDEFIAYLFAGSNTTRWSDMMSPASGTFDYPAELAFNGILQSNPNRLRTSGNAVVATLTLSPAITIQSGQSVVVYGEDAAIGNPYGYSGTATVTIDGTTYTSSSGDTHTFSTSGQLTQVTYVNNSGSGRTYLEGIRVNGDLLTDGSFFVNGDPNYTAGAESKFGTDEDQSIVKCGEYIGNGSSTGPVVNLTWEPQWIMIKRSNSTGNWAVFDCMRNIVSGGDDPVIQPDLDSAEYTTSQYLDLTPTGFQLKASFGQSNADGSTYLYMAIRRPDGYVGKPPSAGTDVFAMDTGNNSGTIPCFDSGFAADYALSKLYAGTQYWQSTARLTNHGNFETNSNRAEEDYTGYIWDSNSGVHINQASSVQAWMWKRHAGFDVVTYTGGGTGDTIAHNLNAVPEMMWVKNRTQAQSWAVYHKGLNGGTNPEQYYQMLNSPLGTNTLGTETNRWNDTAPTSTHFTVGGSNNTGNGGDEFIAMLFASANDADGNPISKLGHYTGDNSTDGSKAITTGFQPRFIVIKASNAEEVWVVLDTLRGIQNSGNDQILYLDRTDAQVAGAGVDISATGFALRASSGEFNSTGLNYIYYAHA